jgi:hypothetical protein
MLYPLCLPTAQRSDRVGSNKTYLMPSYDGATGSWAVSQDLLGPTSVVGISGGGQQPHHLQYDNNLQYTTVFVRVCMVTSTSVVRLASWEVIIMLHNIILYVILYIMLLYIKNYITAYNMLCYNTTKFTTKHTSLCWRQSPRTTR